MKKGTTSSKSPKVSKGAKTKSKKSISTHEPQKNKKELAMLSRFSLLAKTNVIRIKSFIARRPHRSFRLTRRRDYIRKLQLPGYIALAAHTSRLLYKHRRTMIPLVVLYSFMIIFIGAITSQDSYSDIQDVIASASTDIFGQGLAGIGEAGSLAVSAIAGLPAELTVDQQVYAGILLLLVWLCTVWLLREYLLGRKPRLRDGLYNSAAPLVATSAVVLVMLIQIIPVGLIGLLYTGFASTGMIDSGFGSMIFWTVALLTTTLVAFWLTSSSIALVIVTLPGMYPFKALRMASDIVVGRRLRILLRLGWGVLLLAIFWIVIMLVIVALTTAVVAFWEPLQSIPVVPYTGAILTAGSAVWYAAYVYLFYRKLVEND